MLNLVKKNCLCQERKLTFAYDKQEHKQHIRGIDSEDYQKVNAAIEGSQQFPREELSQLTCPNMCLNDSGT